MKDVCDLSQHIEAEKHFKIKIWRWIARVSYIFGSTTSKLRPAGERWLSEDPFFARQYSYYWGDITYRWQNNSVTINLPHVPPDLQQPDYSYRHLHKHKYLTLKLSSSEFAEIEYINMCIKETFPSATPTNWYGECTFCHNKEILVEKYDDENVEDSTLSICYICSCKLQEGTLERKSAQKGKVLIYIFGSRPDDFFKIGRSKNPKQRMASYARKLPFEVEFTHVIPAENAMIAEKYLHDLFRDVRHKGEWFKLDQSKMSYLDNIVGFTGATLADFRVIEQFEQTKKKRHLS